jgi:DNA-directed RNA polymerase subunit F
MPKKVLKERVITLPEAKKLLESIGEKNLDQFQRRSLDYVAKFSKIEANVAEELVNKLITDLEVEEAEAVQIVNSMPESIEELRAFLARGRKIVKTSKLEEILALLNSCR